jgi:hypothetical protein
MPSPSCANIPNNEVNKITQTIIYLGTNTGKNPIFGRKQLGCDNNLRSARIFNRPLFCLGFLFFVSVFVERGLEEEGVSVRELLFGFGVKILTLFFVFVCT